MKYYDNVSFLLVLEMKCLWVSWLANVSLHSGLPSSFLKVSSFGHLLWNWSRLHFPGFGLFPIALGDGFQKISRWSHPNPKRPYSLYHHMSCLYFFLKTFIESLLSSRYLWFGAHFVYGVREYSNLILIFFILISLPRSFIVSLTSVYCQHHIPFSPHLLCQLGFVKLLTVAILSALRWFLPVGSKCVSHV